MGSLLNAVIYIGPAVFLLGLLAAIACFASLLSRLGRPRLLRRALVTAGLGLAGYVVGTGLGIAFFCATASTGNLCGLGGVFGIGPLTAGLCMGGYSVRTLKARRNSP